MIIELKSASNLEPSWAGTKALHLFNLHCRGVYIVDTILVRNALFKIFLETGSVPEDYLVRIIDLTGQGDFLSSSELYVDYSLPKEFHGMEGGSRASRDVTDLKFRIERIYRSWSGLKAKSLRIAKSINHDESFPAILIQPFLDDVATVCTRSPKTGEPTDNENWDGSIHNTVTKFKQEFTEWLARIEYCIKKPRKVYFSDSEKMPVLRVTDQVMTEEASLRLLHESLERGSIDKLEYLSRIEPSKLAIFHHYEWLDPPAAVGLPGSPGFAHGKIVFRTSDWRNLDEDSLICVAEEYHPDDIDLIWRCQGAVTSRGGKTSHAAVICRGMRKPAVVGAEGLSIDEKTRILRCGDSSYREGTWLFVDGNTGVLRFTENPARFPQYVVNSKVAQYVQRLAQVLESFDDKEFEGLSLPLQYHLANLKRALRSIGYLK